LNIFPEGNPYKQENPAIAGFINMLIIYNYAANLLANLANLDF
jgi:hypothetical protein